MKNLLFIFTLLLVATAPSYAQSSKPCKPTVHGGKYKVIWVEQEKGQEGNPFLHLAVEIEKEKFNEDDLAKVAQRIRETYCDQNEIAGYIVEKPKKKLDLADVVPPPIFPLGTRCLYTLNRKTGVEKIAFFNAYFKPTGEPEIVLGKN